jgi:ATP-binding cassette, subfamily B (MDR/TAP), member 1
MVLILYYPVQLCDDSFDPPVIAFPHYDSCQEYWDDVAEYMRELSFKIFYGLMGIIAAAIIGNMLMYTGFGYASERMNKRIRDTTFRSLVRQEVAWFDMNPISRITTRLSEDASKSFCVYAH